MTVYDNIAYGLKVQKKSKKEIDERVMELINLVGLLGKEKRYPNELSGGQRQRVAFARAIAPNPHLLLLDEPFAAIDAKVRGELRTWLKEMINKVGITSIFVTHDQDEAIEIADEIIITNQGRIEQVGSPVEIYKKPATPFVAQFIGKSTVIENAEILKGFNDITKAERAVIRPEFIKISKKDEFLKIKSAAENGIVKEVLYRGSYMELIIDIKGILISATRSLEEELINTGEEVNVLIYRLYIFDEKNTKLVENKALKSPDSVVI